MIFRVDARMAKITMYLVFEKDSLYQLTMVHSRIHKLVYVSRNVFGGTISNGLLAEITYFPPPLELGIRSLIR